MSTGTLSTDSSCFFVRELHRHARRNRRSQKAYKKWMRAISDQEESKAWRGRGAAKKTPVFGILKRGGKVYTETVPDCSRDALLGIIRGKVDLESVIHSESWRSYDGLVYFGYEKHFRVNHSNNEFALKTNHINGIKSFWSNAKYRLIKFNGIAKHAFYLHLKECEWRFNLRNDDLYDILLKELRE